ncbi:MAG: Fic family protein [Gemmatimonadota bacterium]|jgi:Fic family protein
MLFRTPALDEKETEVVARIEDLKRSLRYAVAEHPRRWQGLLRRSTLGRNIQGSNSIEGYNVTVEDAIAAAEGEQPLDADAAAWAAVTGYRAAMTYVLQLADDPHFHYSTDLLRGLHFMMLQHDLDRNPGKWRPGPVFVRDDERNEVGYEGPDATRVPELMDELVAVLEGEGATPALVRAAMAHLNLVMIHPYSDGNGRMARCLQTLVLARTGVLAPPFSSIEEYLGRNTRDYYDVLALVGGGAWHPERDARPWIRFCLTAHYRQAHTLLRRTRELERLWGTLEAEVAKARLPERAVFALADAAVGFQVRNNTYRTAAEISDQLASRDLKGLVDAGLLVPRGERRGRYYVAAPRVLEFRRASAEDKRIADPFAEPTAMPMLPGLLDENGA